MIIISIFLFFCLLSAINYFRTRRQRKAIQNLKGPFTWPLLGAMHQVFLLSARNFFSRSNAYLTKFGAFTRCWAFYRLLIPVADFELATQLLNDEKHLETGYDLMRDWLKGGVLMCEPKRWPQQHQQLRALFESENMVQLEVLCGQHATQLAQHLHASSSSGKVFDCWQTIAPKVLDVILATTCDSSDSHDYARDITDLTELYRDRFLTTGSANRFTYWLTSPFMRSRQMRLIKRIKAHNRQLIANLRPTKNQTNQFQCTVVMKGEQPKRHRSLLDILLASNGLSEQEMCGELNTFNFIGYLYSSTVLCFAMVMIARHPSVQQRCYDELRTADGGRLPFLEAVLRETMRLYPPQVIVGRHLTSDFAYTHSGVGNGVLPKGAEIYINLLELQRNAEDYPRPEEFLPERFIYGPTANLLSYSLGPRTCPAQQFSLILLTAFLAPLLIQFELLPYGDALRLDLRMTLGSHNGFQLALKPRESNKLNQMNC